MTKDIAVIDRRGRPTGEIVSPNEATDRGLWHLGVHAIIYTPDGRVLVQKRSEQAMQFPGYLELSLGGFVDAGETPAQAIIREIREETGLIISEGSLLPISTTRMTYRWRYAGRRKHTRTLIHNFAVQLNGSEPFSPNAAEVSSEQWLPYPAAEHLVRQGILHGIGRIRPLRRYHQKLLRAIRPHITR